MINVLESFSFGEKKAKTFENPKNRKIHKKKNEFRECQFFISHNLSMNFSEAICLGLIVIMLN